ncbi:MAG: flagellar type III secretion system protein FliR [Firmicutes bacterium]|nr:flagellar type III secretion system protein FliR [Bacillota bacterium]
MEITLSKVIGFLPAFVRVTGLVMASPIFGGRGVPSQVKIGLSFVTALVLYPVLPDMDFVGPSVPAYYVLLGRELLVGIGIGFAVTLVFSAIYLAGQLIDVPMGFGMVNVVDPQSGLQVPIFAQFQYILAALVFLAIRGHHALLQALSASFALIPVGQGMVIGNLPMAVLDIFVRMFYLGVKLSLPLVTGLLLLDIALGIVARAVPQINVFVVGFPAKILVGMALFILVLPAYVAFLTRMFGGQGDLGWVLKRVLEAF